MVHLRIEESTLLPGQEWADSAAAWRFVRVSLGAAYWLETARPRELLEGEFLVVQPLVPVVIRASQLNGVVLHRFSFAPDVMCGFFTLAERHLFQKTTTELVCFLPSTHPLNQRFAAVIAQGERSPDIVERAELLGIVAGFFSQSGVNHPRAPEGGNPAFCRFEQIVCQMPELEMLQHSPEDLARVCGCSLRHFNRLFRERFGESVRGRQTELRLLKARQVLADSDKPVHQIALENGYRSLNLFNSLFKRRFGVTPSEWRKTSNRTSGRQF